MWPIPQGLPRRFLPKVVAILLAAFSLLPAEPADSLLTQMTAAQDSTAQAPADSLVPSTSEPQSSQADPRLREDDIPRTSQVDPRDSIPYRYAPGLQNDCGDDKLDAGMTTGIIFSRT